MTVVRKTTRGIKARRPEVLPVAPEIDCTAIWELLMQVSDEAIVVLSNDDARIIKASQSFSDMLGYSAVDLAQMHRWDWDEQWSKADMPSSPTDGPEASYSPKFSLTRMRCKNGGSVDVEISSSCVRWEERAYIFCIVRDVTERKAATRALEEETRRRRLAMESAFEGFALLELQDVSVVEANSAFANMLGYGPDDVIGLHPWDWDVHADKAYIIAALAAQRAGNADPIKRLETVFRRKDGTTFNADVSLSFFDLDDEAYTYAIVRDISASKITERDLRESEAKFRAMFESTRRGIGLFTHDGKHIQSNPVVHAFTGTQPDQTEGRYFWEGDWWQNEADRIKLKDAMDRAGRGEYVQFELSQRTISGEIVVSDFSIAPIQVQRGKVTQILVEANDITARRAAELALRNNEAKFRTLFETSRRLIGILSPEGKNIVTNPVGYAFTGLTPEQTAALYFWEGHWWLNDSDRERIKDAVQRAAAGEYVQFEVRQKGPDGKIHTSDFSIAPIYDGQGKVSSLMPEASDITALKETQAELARREQILTAILKQTPGGVVLINERTHEMVEFNDFACAMHGYTREEFSELTVLDLKADATPDVLQDRKHRTIAEGQITFEDKHRRKDGTVFDVRVSLGRIHVHDEFHTVALWVDISDLKKTERALREKEQEVRTLVDHTPDGIVRYDRELRRVFVNPALRKFVGGDPYTLIGKPLDSPANMVGAELYMSILHETFLSGRSGEIEVQFPRNGRGPLWARISFAPELDACGGVATVLVIAHDVTDVVEHRQRVHQLAFNDPLTALPNRTHFNEQFTHAIETAHQRGETVGLFLLDLDRFKDINDSLGHAAGDELLRQVSIRLSRCMRHSDFLARLGGDEFAVILSNVRDSDDAMPVGDRIIKALRAPFLIAGQEIFASASIGVALYPLDGATPDDLFAHADVAMYDAKKKGRGGIQFYAQELTVEAARRFALGTSLHSACADGELELFYQPKFRLSDDRIVGAEALLRWRHPELGLLAPDTFIGIAEETGLIVEIGRWVLENACRTAVGWNLGRDEPLTVAVNLSSRQFMHNDLVADVRHALASTACRSQWLECEITESLILRDELDVHGALTNLRSMGISIAIDDFGTGQSALAYLNRFHVDVLKIDRSFVDGMEHDKRKAELVRAFISIAVALEMKTVAEGIETEEQARMLQTFGCEVGQGYLLGRPMPAADFERRFIEAEARLESLRRSGEFLMTDEELHGQAETIYAGL